MSVQLALGTCQCGCGNPTPLATRTHRARGLIKGTPTRYLPGHQTRYNELPAEWEDRGYETPCLIWQAATNSRGYPIRGTKAEGLHLVHRRVVEESTGEPLRPEDDVHHLCRNPRCVNRDHLEVMQMIDHRREHMCRACGSYITGPNKPCARCGVVAGDIQASAGSARPGTEVS